tara:strand:+ start:153 stop:1223 length:1071 start_codon:yes stop_codon:yes gene_type:complete
MALSKDLLRRLALAPGVPGSEDAVRAIVRETLSDVGTISYDRLGSVICEKRGDDGSPRVVLDGHMDEVGFMVQSITKEGRIFFVPLGGWWGHVLLAQRVDIMVKDGIVPGVIGSKPPHFIKASERERVMALDSMYIDVGASSRAEVEALGVRLGDPVVPHCEWIDFEVDGVLSCKAFDDRVGVGLMCEVMKSLSAESLPNTLLGVAAAQEEVGCRGASTASTLTEPDVGIVLEGTPADDLPGFVERQGLLGKGPQVRLFDPTALSNRRLIRLVEEIVAENELQAQFAVRRSGATDARSINTFGKGVPTVVIAVPCRYIHTHVALMQWRDYEAAFDLIRRLVLRLDQETVFSLTSFE